MVMMTPQVLLQRSGSLALSAEPGAIFLCGRYEGFDERIRAHVDLERA